VSAPAQERPRRSAPGRAAVAVVLAAGALSFSACTEVESSSVEGYEPAHLEEIKGNPDVKLVKFTSEGARRTGLKTGSVTRNGDQAVIPYQSLIYDAEGKTWIYTSPRPLTYLREPVTVDRIEGDRVFLTKGPRAGTDVVTVGAVEVYGTELEIGSSH
jgi:hypothetical protein